MNRRNALTTYTGGVVANSTGTVKIASRKKSVGFDNSAPTALAARAHGAPIDTALVTSLRKRFLASTGPVVNTSA